MIYDGDFRTLPQTVSFLHRYFHYHSRDGAQVHRARVG